MTDATTETTTRWRHWTVWGGQALLACAFLAAGGQKLVGAERVVTLFAEIG